MQELNNQLLAATNPFEVIEISDKILKKRLDKYIKHLFLKGEMLLSLGRFDEAISIFEQILEYDEDEFIGRAHNSIGFCYSMKNEPKIANSEFEKAHKFSDDQSLLLNSATLNLACYYSMTNQKEDTFKIFKELYDLNPINEQEDTHILFLTLAKDPEEHIEIYNQNIDESFPKDENVMARKAVALINLKRFDEAIPILEDALKYIDEDNKEALGAIHIYLGFSYFNINQLDNAISEFEMARKYSDDSSILHKLANYYELANQKEKALETYKELSIREPYNQEIKQKIENLKREINGKDVINELNFNSLEEAMLQANIYWQQGEYENAVMVYDLVTDFLPENPPAWHNKGFSYYQLGRYEEAMDCFDKALKYNPNSKYSMFYKSSIYMEEEDYENAEDMIVKALNISPNAPEFLYNYCFILNQLGKYKEAINVANKLLIIQPDSFETYYNKAFALENLKRFDEAIECYDKSLKINPNNFQALANKGLALENLDRLDEAIECYNKALTLSPNNTGILNRLSFIKAKKDGSKIVDLYL